ncbi:transglutaminase-like domain-containing protein [Leisingera sp.]|uniref:transglutaminase-like domain-containing protein n=1 Tax=Leisingera sp. TaxID=1879318 RepID=UPI002B26C2BC|nr:transglutaminase-like domain-containing protein [Leisingera sp.]
MNGLAPEQRAALTATEVLDIQHPDVRAASERALADGAEDDTAKAVAFYYAVRDGISYEVFGTGLSDNDLKASSILKARRGFCLHKAILFAALCRSQGIPCRIAAARVRNHISSPNLTKLVGGDVFLHWFNQVWLQGRWVKAAPVFNQLLCRIYRIPPLEFDGTGDAFVQGHMDGQEMQYLDSPVRFEAPTAEQLVQHVGRHHPLMVPDSLRVPREREIAAL